MKFRKPLYRWLLSALGAVGATAASAQTQPAASAPSEEEGLKEIVVTATRQSDSVNRVPLSITAVTQEDLDQQGIKTGEDLVRLAPALAIRRGIDSSDTIAIRGIISTAGSQTTGVYLDDTPLQKRTAIGAANGNGSPMPFLFDLERVEVLRGPQGTLYGGSSLGGTIRFITPTPSLTQFSVGARAEQSFTQTGDPSTEVGAAVGGPIVQDKLGFRISAYSNQVGGYIDRYNIYTGQQVAQNSNGNHGHSIRASLAWAPSDALLITPQVFYSYQRIEDADFFFRDIPQFTVGPIVSPNTGTGFPAYTYPAHTYGPISAGPYKSFLLNPYGRTNEFAVPALNVDYDLGSFALKSITSYIYDDDIGHKDGGFDNPGNQLGGTGLVSELPGHVQNYQFYTDRRGWTQEIRLTSKPGSRLQWLAGLYGQSITTVAEYKIYEDLNEIASVIHGSSVEAFYHAPMLAGGIAGDRYQSFKEKEAAVFGNLTYAITDNLKASAGVRAATNEFDFFGTYIGPLVGTDVVSLATGSLTQGTVKEHPITPKFGLEYQLDERKMLYLSAAKGYRQGGVNTTAQTAGCSAALAVYGGNPPDTYKSDTIWSYEAGTKLRFSNRVQFNASAFLIDWSGIQTNVPLPGCFTFVENAAKARSQGFDVQAQAQLFGGLTAGVAASYTDARYTEALLGPVSAINGTQAHLINKDDPLAVPPVTVAVNATYDTDIGTLPVYARVDYSYNSAFRRTFGPGTTTYGADIYEGNPTRIASARLGMKLDNYDVSLFVDNLFDSQDILDAQLGRSGCTNLSCSTYSYNNRLIPEYSFRPRTFGITVTYKR